MYHPLVVTVAFQIDSNAGPGLVRGAETIKPLQKNLILHFLHFSTLFASRGKKFPEKKGWWEKMRAKKSR